MALVLSACPIPFDSEELSLLQDLTAPVITFTAPLTGSPFQSTVTIAGTVVDLDRDGTARTGTASAYIASAGYSIQGEETGETVLTIGDDGSFSFSLATADYDNQITVVVTATDKNGNVGTASITLAPDSDGPFLAITSPGDYGEYATVITLSGCASNSSADTATTEVAPTILYKMPGTNISGSLTLDADGTFSATIDVSALSGDHTIEITASDLNGNETTAIITIVKPDIGGDISGFTVTPGIREVTISWDPVPYAESYTIMESRFIDEVTGIDPSATSYTWDGLSNGTLYRFQLVALLPEGTGSDACSAAVEAMPLSVRTLAPWVKETGYGSITMEWFDGADISEYAVERSLSYSGPWEVVQNTTNNSYMDSDVEKGTAYFYRITPTDYGDIHSKTAAAVPGYFPYPSTGGTIVGIKGTGANVRGVTLSGDYAFLAVSSSSEAAGSLTVVDISNPQRPEKTSTVTVDGTANNLTLSGSYAYLAWNKDASGGIAIIDIGDPENPGAPVYLATGTIVYGIDTAEINGSRYAFLAHYSSGITVVDVSNPSVPVQVGGYIVTGGNPRSVDVMTIGGSVYAFVADGTAGLTVIDVTDPASPGATQWNRDTNGSANDVMIVQVDSSVFAFIADGTEGLAVIDVTTPASPGTAVYEDTAGTAYGVFVSGTTAFVADNDCGLQALDISDPADPQPPVQTDTMGSSYEVTVRGDYAYVADYGKGLAIVDLSNPEDPAFIGAASSANPIMDVAVAGNYAYAVDYKLGVAVYDISDPEAVQGPYVCGSWAGNAYGVAVSGNRAYIADGDKGIAVADISDPAAPILLSPYLDTVGSSRKVVISGDYLFVADETGGFVIIDISGSDDRGEPIYCPTPGNAYDVAVSGNYAYVAANDGGLVIFDVSDPEHPGTGTVRATSANAVGVTVAGGYAYVALENGSLAYIDVSDPENPGTATNVVGMGSNGATAVTIAGYYAFVTGDSDGLAVIDISDPASPGLPSYFPCGSGAPNGVAITGRYAFVADDDAGLSIIELWDGNE